MMLMMMMMVKREEKFRTLTRRLLVGDFIETILKHLVQMEMFVVARGHFSESGRSGGLM